MLAGQGVLEKKNSDADTPFGTESYYQKLKKRKRRHCTDALKSMESKLSRIK